MIRIIVAFLATAMTAIQAYLLYKGKPGICFNDGCAVVDSLTTVSPFYINIAGFIFFLLLFWAFLWGRENDDYQQKFGRLLLQAGMGAEAVLIYFQYNIATAFCSYCLIVFSFILLLNILSGLKQLFRAVVIFAVIFVTCSSLQFKAGGTGSKSLAMGTVAQVAGNAVANHILVFSKTCPHCEKVIESLRQNNSCSINFNPLERFDDFQFPGAKKAEHYDPQINISFLRRIGIGNIPLLMAQKEDEVLLLVGEKKIFGYIDANCRKTEKSLTITESAAKTTGQSAAAPEWKAGNGSKAAADAECSTAADCAKQAGEIDQTSAK